MEATNHEIAQQKIVDYMSAMEYRMTWQRKKLLELIPELDSKFDPADLIDLAADHDINKSTVYAFIYMGVDAKAFNSPITKFTFTEV